VRLRRALLVGGGTVVALAVGSLVGGVVFDPSSAASTVTTQPALSDAALRGTSAGVTAATVAGLEARVAAAPSDAESLTELGFAYQLRWRETADASYLPRSAAALRRALRLEPKNASAVLGLGSLALIRHEFRQALAYGRRARLLLPGSARPFGVIGDALVELGRYRQAFAAFDRMGSLRPSLASYARVAYARELTGDLHGAASAMRLALQAAGGVREPTAWSLVELAKLELLLGHPRVAARDTRDALRIFPGYPSARAELALVELAEGRLEPAIADARLAADAVPTQQAVALLGALLDRAGAHAAARRQLETVSVIQRILRANGVHVDLEAAVFRADYRIRPEQTVELARSARAERPSIYGDDAFAWALARAGRCSEALPLARRALHLGTQDPLLFFHLGYAERCEGDATAAQAAFRRALALNPEFSPRWAPVARVAVHG
jgi:tetratricopeptide (TPR) repeat protein